MDPVHEFIVRNQQLMSLLVAICVFMGLVGVGIGLATVRLILRSRDLAGKTEEKVDRVSEMLRDVRESSEREAYYLFNKFGPLDTK